MNECQKILLTIERNWPTLPVPLSVHGVPVRAEDLSYEELDMHRIWSGKSFDDIDCRIAMFGLPFNPFYYIAEYPGFYYCGAVARCYLMRHEEGAPDLNEILYLDFSYAVESFLTRGYQRKFPPHVEALQGFVATARGWFED